MDMSESAPRRLVVAGFTREHTADERMKDIVAARRARLITVQDAAICGLASKLIDTAIPDHQLTQIGDALQC